MFFTITYDDGIISHRRVQAFRAPPRIAYPGDVYAIVLPFTTLADKFYTIGDTLEIIERTREVPHNLNNSLGNCRVKCKYFTSIWTGIELMLGEGIITLIKRGPRVH